MLRVVLRVVLRVAIRVVLWVMVGSGVVRGVGIFPGPNFPVRPKHVITAIKATTATKRKTIIIRYFLSGIGGNSAGDGPSCSGVGDINANEY